MTVNMPFQCFINGQFTDAEDGKTYDTINPTDGSVSNRSVGIVTTGRGFLVYTQLSDRQSQEVTLFYHSASEHFI